MRDGFLSFNPGSRHNLRRTDASLRIGQSLCTAALRRLTPVLLDADTCSHEQDTLSNVANLEPLTPTEETFWRALMRIALSLPRQLGNDLIRGAGLTASEYTVIMNLSEAPNRQLRMADLANACGLSPSRTTRLVDDLQSRGWVIKRASSSDGRSNLAELTSRGLGKLKSAWPEHLASVRSRVFDRIDPVILAKATEALEAVAAKLDEERVDVG